MDMILPNQDLCRTFNGSETVLPVIVNGHEPFWMGVLIAYVLLEVVVSVALFLSMVISIFIGIFVRRFFPHMQPLPLLGHGIISAIARIIVYIIALSWSTTCGVLTSTLPEELGVFIFVIMTFLPSLLRDLATLLLSFTLICLAVFASLPFFPRLFSKAFQVAVLILQILSFLLEFVFNVVYVFYFFSIVSSLYRDQTEIDGQFWFFYLGFVFVADALIRYLGVFIGLIATIVSIAIPMKKKLRDMGDVDYYG